MPTRSPFGGCCALAIAMTVSTVAFADDAATAAQLFQEGEAAYARKDLTLAATRFEEAFRLAPRGAAAFNAGLAWEAAKEPARAADAYARALEATGLSAADERHARARLAALQRETARLRITEPAGARLNVAHVKDGTVPSVVHLPPGLHVVEVITPEGRGELRIELARGANIAVGVPIGVITTAPAAPAPATTNEPTPTTERSDVRPWAFASIGLGVAASVTAVLLGLRALDARDEFVASGETSRSAHDRAVSLRLWTNVAWAGALAFGGTGVVLLLTAPKADAPPAAFATWSKPF